MEANNFIKKILWYKIFSWEFFQFFKSPTFVEHPQTAASVLGLSWPLGFVPVYYSIINKTSVTTPYLWRIDNLDILQRSITSTILFFRIGHIMVEHFLEVRTVFLEVSTKLRSSEIMWHHISLPSPERLICCRLINMH